MEHTKKNCILIFLILISLNPSAQTFKTVTLIEQRNYYLNGGARAHLGGKSRVTIKVDLPPNTKKWYYSFSTSPGESGTQLLNLGLQIGAALTTGGMGEALASSIKVPAGSGSADVLVLPPEYNEVFLSKEDNRMRFYSDISLQNTKQAVQSIDKTNGNSFYLGLRNPSAMNGINIFIEVVAIVEEVSEESDKGTLYGSLGWKAYEDGELDKSVELSHKALTCNSNLAFVKFNIGLVHLAQEKDESIDDYVNAAASSKTDKNPKRALTIALQNVRNLKLKNPNLKNIKDVEDVLLVELKKY